MNKSYRIFKIIHLIIICGYLFVTNRRNDIPMTVFDSLRELGGLYVKFLQLIVVRNENFAAYIGIDVYDKVATEPINIHQFFKNELGKKYHEITNISDNPIAAGSFAQVYTAEHEGKRVILKVLRPSVIKYLNTDLRMITTLAWMIDVVLPSSGLSLNKVIKKFAETTKLETNYYHEADYATTMYHQYETHTHVVVPYTYRHLSTRRMICQDFMDGLLLNDVLRSKNQNMNLQDFVLARTGSDLVVQMRSLGIEMLTSVFKYSACYGDPHPGNIILLADNKVALIDFGIRAAAPSNLSAFRDVIEQYATAYNGRLQAESYVISMLRMYGGKLFNAVESLRDYFDIDTKMFYEVLTQSTVRDLQNNTDPTLTAQRGYLPMLSDSNKDNSLCLKYEIDGHDTMRAGLNFIALAASLGIKEQVVGTMYIQTNEWLNHNFRRSPNSYIHPDEALEITVSWLDRLSDHNPHMYKRLEREVFKNESVQFV